MNDEPNWLQAHNLSLLHQYQEESTLDDAEFQEKFIDILPKNWTVCSLSLEPETGEIYAVQLRQRVAPLVFKIPISRMESNASFRYEDAVTEMKGIIAESDVTIAASRDCVENAHVEKWWNTRKELDDRLRKLLVSIENQWLGGFKGILSGQVAESKEEINRFQKSASELIFKAANTKKRIEISLNCCRMILRLGYNPPLTHLEDFIRFFLSCYELQEVKMDYKKIMIAELTQNLKMLVSQYHEKSRIGGIETTKTQPDEHVILILDKHLHMFPLESMPLLRSQSVSRLPSLSLLRDRILYAKAYNNRKAFDDFGLVNASEWKDLYVSEKSTYYVINPSGDLKHTQQEFEKPFKRAPGWDGLVNEMPTELQSKSSLLSREIYIYMGHGAGQSFMRGQVVKQLPTCAVSLLMGCSSGALKSNGDYDPHGYVLNYLLGGR
ncbi:hypothetical protein K501DRAFT_169633 [Backusella circina FSU 941]|nr:hypothetical protein K501DRAFT_169633 [Backusella circina FSU 941]